MTLNAKIAEKMGWIKYFGDEPVITDSGHKVSFQFIRTPDGDIDFDLKIDTQTAHLLIERMVGDGWEITTNIGKERGWAEALRFDGELYHRIGVDHEYKVAGNNSVMDFPTAVVELFCRVYSIDGSADHSGKMECNAALAIPDGE